MLYSANHYLAKYFKSKAMVKETLKAPHSHYLLSAELSQEVDRRTIEEANIDGFTLMEVAGSSAAKIILGEQTNLSHGIFLCGKGNNAGDALVIARYLVQNGINATPVFISGTGDLSADTQKNLELLKHFDSQNRVTLINSWAEFDGQTDFDFIIDGMLGTGLNSDVRNNYADAVNWINKQNKPVFAIDIPTGLHADTGAIMGCAVQATRTFAFGGRKQGFYLEEGPSLTGTISYCELPFPNKYKESSATYLLDESWISSETPTPGRHKYDSGVLYIIAGSEGLTGAAMLAAQSAWAEGLGAVILVCPRGVLSIYEQNLPSIIKKPVGSRKDYFFKEDHTPDVLDIIGAKDGKVLIGPGLGRDSSTVSFVGSLLSQNTADTVIDADGLWCLSQLSEWPKPDESQWILTPHPGELRKLTENDISSDFQRLETTRNYAREYNVTLLSKGMPGIIGTPTGKCYVTNYNTRYFARAGSGDVLSGKISAELALENPPDKSCALALLHGKIKLNYLMQNTEGIPEPSDFI